MPSTSIRPGRTDDLDAILSMLRAFHATHLAWDLARWTTATPPHASYAEWIGELIASGDADGCVRVAEVDGIVGGYLVAQVEPESSRHWSPRAVYLHDLFVAPPHRRLGLARALMARLFAWADAHHGDLQLRLMTAAPNEPARAFFATLGFRPCVVEMIRVTDEPKIAVIQRAL